MRDARATISRLVDPEPPPRFSVEDVLRRSERRRRRQRAVATTIAVAVFVAVAGWFAASVPSPGEGRPADGSAVERDAFIDRATRVCFEGLRPVDAGARSLDLARTPGEPAAEHLDWAQEKLGRLIRNLRALVPPTGDRIAYEGVIEGFERIVPLAEQARVAALDGSRAEYRQAYDAYLSAIREAKVGAIRFGLRTC